MEESDPTCVEALEKNCLDPGKEARRAGVTAFGASPHITAAFWASHGTLQGCTDP